MNEYYDFYNFTKKKLLPKSNPYEGDLMKILQTFGYRRALELLTNEIIEEKLREEDPNLMDLWAEYKALATLQRDFSKVNR